MVSTKGQIISEKYWYYFHCQTHTSFHYLKLCHLNFPTLGQRLIDSGIHFEMQKEELISSRVEQKPLVTLILQTQFQNLFFEDSF